MTFEEIVKMGRDIEASDIHFVAGLPPVFRKDGEIFKLSEEYNEGDYKDMILELIPKDLKGPFAMGHDADFAYVDQYGQRYRVNIFRQMGNVGCSIRLLSSSMPTLESLALPDVLKKFAMLPRGLVLITGPTGSGKSTTLAAMIDYANMNRKSHIITVEDPVEYRHYSKECIVNQREIGVDVASFSDALRSAMREDPDIILLGEMRDYETISAAITAAETGHLVLSTLHTTGAANTIDRIIDVFPPHQQVQIRTQLASVLRGIVTQQLVRKKEGGRCAALEILVSNDAISNMIREGKTHQVNSSMQTGNSEGMILLDKYLAKLVNEEIIDMDVALEKCVKEDEFKRFLNVNGKL